MSALEEKRRKQDWAEREVGLRWGGLSQPHGACWSLAGRPFKVDLSWREWGEAFTSLPVTGFTHSWKATWQFLHWAS